MPKSRLSPHAEHLSYPDRSWVLKQLPAAALVLVKHSPNLADFSTGSNMLMSILHSLGHLL